MEIRQGFRSVPSRPIAVVLALLAVLALSLTTWFVFSVSGSSSSVNNHSVQDTRVAPQSCDPNSPRDPICEPAGDSYSPHDPL